MSTFDDLDDGLRAAILHTVLTRVAAEPRPTPSRAFVAAVRRGSPKTAFIALATAWHLATLRDRPIALGSRVRAAGLALGVGGLLASSGAVALASVAGVAGEVATRLSAPAQVEPQRPVPTFTASPTERPVLAPPSEAPATTSPSRPSDEPSPSASPSPKPEHTPRPTTRPRAPHDGHDGSGGTPRPSSGPGGDHGGGDSGGGGSNGGDSGGPGGGNGGGGQGGGGTGTHPAPTPEPTDPPGAPPIGGSGGG